MAEIRSVSVRLDADVAGYIAKMKLAGAATDQAFSGTDSRIKSVNTQLSGVEGSAAKAERGLRGLEGTNNRVGNSWANHAKKLDGFVSKLVTLPALAIAATSALQPLAVSALAVGAAFAAPLAFAGGGLGLFAILGLAAVTQTNKQIKNIDTIQKKLSGLTKGTAAYAAAQKELTAAQNALTPAQEAYSKATDHFGDAFHRLLSGQSGQALLGPITQAINLGANLLPKVEPIITSISGALSTLIADLSRYSNTKDFEHFVRDVAKQAGPDLLIFGHAIGDVAHGIGDLLDVTGKSGLSRGFMRGLGDLSQNFSDWASSKGARRDVHDFIDYFHKVGPDVAHTIGSVATALGHISHALEPISPVTLGVIRGIANEISSIPIPVLTALASAAVGLSAFQKVGGFKLLSLAKGGNPLTGAPGGGLLGKTGAVPVIVTNWPPTLGGGPGGPGVEPVPTGIPKGGLPGAATAAEREAIAAAKAAAAAKVAAGASAEEVSAAAAKAFKAAMAAGEASAVRSIFTFGKIGGLGGLFRTLLGAPIPALGSVGNQPREKVLGGKAIDLHGAQAQKVFNNDEFITGTSKKIDGLTARLGKAGAAMDLVGHSAQRAFGGNATKAVGDLSGKLDRVGGSGAKASRAFDVVGHSAAANSARASGAISNMSGKLDRVGGSGARASHAFDVVGHSAASNSARASGAIGGVQRSLDSLPAKKNVNVTANTGQALSALGEVIAGLSQIHDKHVTVTTTNANIAEATRHASGGYITGPGGPRSDSIPARLSNGEYVVNAAATSRNLGLLHSINAQGFANGGPVATFASSGSSGGLVASDRRLRSEVDGAARGLKALRIALASSTKTLDKERQHRDDLISQRDDLSSTIASNFRSQLFGVQAPTPDTTGTDATTTTTGNNLGIWAAGAIPPGETTTPATGGAPAGPPVMTDPLSILRGNIRDARAYTRDIRKLRRRGLAGGALGEVTTLDEAQQALGLSGAELKQITKAYAIRDKVSQAAGDTTGNAVFGKAINRVGDKIDVTNARVHDLTQAVRHLEAENAKNAKATGDALGQQLNGAAATAVKRRTGPR